MGIVEASGLFYDLIDQRNEKVLARLASKQDPDPATRVERLDRIGATLVDIFDPVSRYLEKLVGPGSTASPEPSMP